jgi:hypothetical protein
LRTILLVAILALTSCGGIPKGGRITNTVTHNDHATTTTHSSYRVVVVPVPEHPASAPLASPPVANSDTAGFVFVLPEFTVTKETTGKGAVTTTAVNDDSPKGPLNFTANGVSVSTSGSQTQPRPDNALGMTSPSVWFGVALAGIGVLLIVLRFIPGIGAMFALIPLWLSFVLIGAGAAFIALPVWIDRYSWLVPFVVIGALVAVLLYFAVKLGWFHKETSPAKVAELKAEGHHDAAGALTFLATGGDKDAAKFIAKPGTPPPPTTTATIPSLGSTWTYTTPGLFAAAGTVVMLSLSI